MPDCITPRSAAMRVLRELEEATKSYDERINVVLRESDWEIGKVTKDSSSSAMLSADAISSLSREHQQIEYAIRLLEALKVSAINQERLLRGRLEPIASKLSKGLASLPDELLAHILKLAAQHRHKGTRHATWLSQVSRRFRRIVLGDRTLWTTLNLWNDTTKEELERIIARSGDDTDLHVVLNMNREIRSQDVGKFICNSTSSFHRWRTLAITGEWDDDDSLSLISMDATIASLMRLYALDLPRLDEICINERHFDADNEYVVHLSAPNLGLHESPPWITPNLRALRCNDFIPFASFPLSSMSLFAISLTLIPDEVPGQIGRLVTYLRSIPNITEIELELKNHNEAADLDHVLRIEPLVFQQVTSFRLHLTQFQLSEDLECVAVPVMKAIQMPNLQSFSLCIQLRDNVGYYLVHSTEALIREFLRDLIPDPITHSYLTSFAVELDSRECEGGEAGYAMMKIMLNEIPHVSTLSLKGVGRVSFSTKESGVSGTVAPRFLRELELTSCNEAMGVLQVEDMVQSLKDVNAWDTLERVLVRGCKSLDYDSALKAIGKERLCFKGR